MELALGQKGPVAPPPDLDQPYQTAATAIAVWDEVITATHWHLSRKAEVDGIDFYVGERELGHIHLDGWVHLATNHSLCKSFLGRGLAEAFPYSSYEHWVSYKIESVSQAKHATWLFHLNYLRLRGFAENELLREIQQYPVIPSQPTGDRK